MGDRRAKKEAILSRLRYRDQPPVFLKVRSSKLFITICVCIAVFSDIFLYGVIIPVLPFAIKVRANVASEDVQHWVSVLLAVYGAALLVSAPICGMIADRTKSRRGPLLVGLLILEAATVMLCVGRSIGMLLAGRLLQGASAGLVWTVALALLSDTVGKEQSGHALGYVAMSYSLGVLVAPLLGGVVYDKAGYYAVFGMIFGIIALDVVLRLLIVEKKIAAKWLPQETNESSVEQGIELQNFHEQSGTEQEKVSASTAANETATIAKKRRFPAMLVLLKSRRILAAFWGNFVGATCLGALDSTLPIFVNRKFGWNSTGAGLIFIAIIVPSFTGPLIGHLTDKYGPRWFATCGLILALPSFVLLRLVDHDSISQIVLLCALLALVGLSAALILTSLMSEFSKVCDAKEKQDPGLFGNQSAYAQAYGIFNVAWAAGTLVGPLWAAAVQKDSGWKTLTWTLGLFNIVSVVPVVLYSGGFIVRRKVSSVPEQVAS